MSVYAFLSAKRLARVDNPLNATSATMHYYFSDYLASTSVVSNSVGVLQQESTYYPYGGESALLGGDSNHYKFTGVERDLESGLDHMQARYFGSTLARFLSVDPENAGADTYDPQSWNACSYVENNSLALTDPSGLAPPWEVQTRRRQLCRCRC